MKFHLPVQEWWPLIKKSVTAWIDDFAPSMGAALSYYTVFSLAPMLLIVIAVAGLIFGQEAAQGALFEQLQGLMGKEAAAGIQAMLAGASKPSEGVIGTVIGVVVLLIGATTVFGELQDALNRIWQVPQADKGGGIWALIRTRFLSFGMILGIAFLLMVSLVLSTAVSALGKWWSPIFGGWEIVAQAVTFIFGLVVTTFSFAMIYKLMPRASVQWRDVWIGAFVTAVLFSLGRFLIGLYIGKSDVASGYGAAGSLIVVFLWVYYSAQIFLLGAEFTWTFATTYGSKKDIPSKALPSGQASDKAAPAENATSTNPMTALRPKSTLSSESHGALESPTIPLVIGGFMSGIALRYILPRVLKRLIGR